MNKILRSEDIDFDKVLSDVAKYAEDIFSVFMKENKVAEKRLDDFQSLRGVIVEKVTSYLMNEGADTYQTRINGLEASLKDEGLLYQKTRKAYFLTQNEEVKRYLTSSYPISDFSLEKYPNEGLPQRLAEFMAYTINVDTTYRERTSYYLGKHNPDTESLVQYCIHQHMDGMAEFLAETLVGRAQRYASSITQACQKQLALGQEVVVPMENGISPTLTGNDILRHRRIEVEKEKEKEREIGFQHKQGNAK